MRARAREGGGGRARAAGGRDEGPNPTNAVAGGWVGSVAARAREPGFVAARAGARPSGVRCKNTAQVDYRKLAQLRLRQTGLGVREIREFCMRITVLGVIGAR